MIAIACACAAGLIILACGGSPAEPTSLHCDESLWTHVYSPSRLQVFDACRSMTGVVQQVHQNDDGDVDMQVTPDTQYQAMLNDANRTKLNGALQVEAVCQAPIQPDRPNSVPACGSYVGTVLIPAPGQHVRVVGSYVLDTAHDWMEIHPVTSITVLTP